MVMVSIGVEGGPIDVNRPFVALKSRGSSRAATFLIHHVKAGEVVRRTMSFSSIGQLSFVDDDLTSHFSFSHSIEGIIDFIESDPGGNHFVQA